MLQRLTMITKLHKAIAELASKVVTDDSHGYSQIHRLGDGTESCYYLNSLEKKVCVHGGDYDCSSFVYEVLHSLGFIPKQSLFYTGNEIEILEKNGFTRAELWKPHIGMIQFFDLFPVFNAQGILDFFRGTVET